MSHAGELFKFRGKYLTSVKKVMKKLRNKNGRQILEKLRDCDLVMYPEAEFRLGYKCLDCHKSFITKPTWKLHQAKRNHDSKILFCRYCHWTFREKHQFDQHAREYPPRFCIPLSLKKNSENDEFSQLCTGGYNEDWIKSNSTPSEKFNIYEYLDKSETEKSLDLPKIQEELSKKKQPKIPSKIVTSTLESSAKIIPNQVVGASITLGNHQISLSIDDPREAKTYRTDVEILFPKEAVIEWPEEAKFLIPWSRSPDFIFQQWFQNPHVESI